MALHCFLFAIYVQTFIQPYITYLDPKDLKISQQLHYFSFTLSTYEHLQTLTFSSRLLNLQLQSPTLILVNKVPSVSYCSTVMLYAVFNCLCLRCFTKCASQ